MSTTSVIVEILLIGFFASVWIFLFFLRLSSLEFQSVRDFLSQAGPWSTALILACTAVFYELGILMNTISYELTKGFSQRQYRDDMIPGTAYEIVRATVFEKGSEETLRNLVLYLSFVRLARSGIVNFFLIAIGMFLFGGKVALGGCIALLLSIGCIPLWRGDYRLYYARMKSAYLVIVSSHEQSGTLGQ